MQARLGWAAHTDQRPDHLRQLPQRHLLAGGQQPLHALPDGLVQYLHGVGQQLGDVRGV